LPFYPDPIPFEPLVQGIKENLERVRADGRLGMVGEVGLDGGARVLWPKEAKHLYDEEKRRLRSDWRQVDTAREQGVGEGIPGAGSGDVDGGSNTETDDDDWKRLAPFKISMAHQQAILKAQMEVAVDLGVPVSLHCVAAPGEYTPPKPTRPDPCCSLNTSLTPRTHNGHLERDARQIWPEVHQPCQRGFAFRRRLVSRVLGSSSRRSIPPSSISTKSSP
jgi:hypothetical protein